MVGQIKGHNELTLAWFVHRWSMYDKVIPYYMMLICIINTGTIKL